ncbi:MAG: hypothetical protein M3Z33_06035 [Actinomycetota bacterium]|nr:hypothetical protein [Actinomycetota bacterium]
MRRRITAVSLCVLAGALSFGCGNRRSGVPDLATPQRPEKSVPYTYSDAQLRFSAPRNWTQNEGRLPVVAQVISGRAAVAIWRYRRREPLPETPAALNDARAQLADAARRRDRTLAIRSSRLVMIHGLAGVELIADETVAGQPKRVRSTHLYGRRAEYVIDASAPPDVFARVDRTVFAPLVASVQPGRVSPDGK